MTFIVPFATVITLNVAIGQGTAKRRGYKLVTKITSESSMESVIKPFELHQLDPRAEMFGWSPDERFELMESVAINRTVPEHVQRLIVTSKNLVIHSCFYYPFNVTAVQSAFSALELAIRLRADGDGLNSAFKGLRGAMVSISIQPATV